MALLDDLTQILKPDFYNMTNSMAKYDRIWL